MRKRMVLLLLFSIFTAGCSVEPEIIIETVVVESTVEVPMTVEVTRQLEVTRQVDIPIKIIQEIEVTRIVPVEVTRIVNTVVTATPTATEEPNATATTASSGTEGEVSEPAELENIAVLLLQSAQTTAENVGLVTDMMAHACRTGELGNASGRGKIVCGELVSLSDSILNVPTFNVSGSPQPLQDAYGQYRWAVETFAAGEIMLLVGQCRTDHVGETETEISSNTACNLSNQMQEPRGALDIAISTLQNYIGR